MKHAITIYEQLSLSYFRLIWVVEGSCPLSLPRHLCHKALGMGLRLLMSLVLRIVTVHQISGRYKTKTINVIHVSNR